MEAFLLIFLYKTGKNFAWILELQKLQYWDAKMEMESNKAICNFKNCTKKNSFSLLKLKFFRYRISSSYRMERLGCYAIRRHPFKYLTLWPIGLTGLSINLQNRPFLLTFSIVSSRFFSTVFLCQVIPKLAIKLFTPIVLVVCLNCLNFEVFAIRLCPSSTADELTFMNFKDCFWNRDIGEKDTTIM